MYLDELFHYKNRLMKDLVENPRIIKLLQDEANPQKKPEDFIYTQLFPFEFIPETVEHGKVIISFDVDVMKSDSKTYYDPVIYVWIVCHKSKMRLPEGGVRMDEIAIEIVKTLSGSRHYGLGELDFFSSRRFASTNDYTGKQLTFHAKDFNHLHAYAKEIPNNRREL